MTLAVIIPVFNEEAGVRRHIAEIDRILRADGLDCRFMLVDDGSRDGTWRELETLAREMPNVEAIRFARNFGKETAICAGLDAIDAPLYLVMDSDLQHPPRCAAPMLRLLRESGADIVDGVKKSRGTESFRTRVLAKGFYRLLALTTGIDMDNSSDFKLFRRDVALAIRSMPERNEFFRTMVDYVGFQRVEFPFETEDRDDGGSRFSTRKLLKLAFNGILSNTSAPLYLSFWFALLCKLGVLAVLLAMLVTACRGQAVTSLQIILLVLLFGLAMVLTALGVLGAYLARVYDEAKGRPRYIVSRRAGGRHAG